MILFDRRREKNDVGISNVYRILLGNNEILIHGIRVL